MNDINYWIKNKYSYYWIDRVKEYGFDEYCKGLCAVVENKHPKSVYEIGIGTGWPFAINFYNKGMKVSGSDISEILIKDLNTHFPEIRASIGSYDEIKCEIEKYDVVYCFRSTWYFSDIFKALDVMFNMSKNGGSVVFDIMNSDSLFNRMIILKHRFLLPYNFVKNIVKLALNLVLGKKYLLQDLWNIHEIPVSVFHVEEYLINRGIKFKIYSISELERGRSASIGNPKASSKVLFDCIAN